MSYLSSGVTNTVSAVAFLALALSVFAVVIGTLALLGSGGRGLPAGRIRYSGGRARRRGSRGRAATSAPRSPSRTSRPGAGHELDELRDDLASALRHVAVVRYDAFGDMGGHLSWSLALLDDHGDGVVVTSIHGRSDARTYAKNLTDWSSNQQLSPEEQQALAAAHGGR